MNWKLFPFDVPHDGRVIVKLYPAHESEPMRYHMVIDKHRDPDKYFDEIRKAIEAYYTKDVYWWWCYESEFTFPDENQRHRYNDKEKCDEVSIAAEAIAGYLNRTIHSRKEVK